MVIKNVANDMVHRLFTRGLQAYVCVCAHVWVWMCNLHVFKLTCNHAWMKNDTDDNKHGKQ